MPKLQSHFYQFNEGRDEWIVRFDDKSTETYFTESEWQTRVNELKEQEAKLAAKQQFVTDYVSAVQAFLDARDQLRKRNEEYDLLYDADGADTITDDDLADTAYTAQQVADVDAIVAGLLAYPGSADLATLLKFVR